MEIWRRCSGTEVWALAHILALQFYPDYAGNRRNKNHWINYILVNNNIVTVLWKSCVFLSQNSKLIEGLVLDLTSSLEHNKKVIHIFHENRKESWLKICEL